MSFTMHGIGVSSGIAIGHAHLMSHAAREVAHYSVPKNKIEAEIARFDAAIKSVQKELQALYSPGGTTRVSAEFEAFLDLHQMILNDPTLSKTPRKIIEESQCN